MADIRQAIRDQIKAEFMDGRSEELTDDLRLVETEVIDSLGTFLLVGFIKEKVGVEVHPEDVTLENFATVDAIVGLVESKAPTG